MNRTIAVVVMAALTSLAAVGSRVPDARAATTTVPAVADAYVDASAPKQRFGSATTLLTGASPTRVSYLRFDLTAVPAPVTGATLILTGPASITGFEVRGVPDTNWNEKSISYQNAPTVGTTVLGSFSGSSGAGPRSVALTGVTAGRPITVALISQATPALSFSSREAGATGPRLELESADLGAPAVTLTAPANGSATNQPQPVFGGAAGTAAGDSPTVAVNVYAGTAATGTPVQTLQATAGGGSWSVTASTPLAEGVYTAQAQQADDAGNVGRSAANTFTVDTTAPVVALTSPAAGALTNSRTPVLSGTASASGAVTVRVYAGTAASGTPVQTLSATVANGSWSTQPAALADGTYTARAQQADAAGNVGESAARTFTIDATPPAVTLTSPAAGSVVSSTPTFAGAAGTAAGDATTITVRVYGGTSATGTPVQILQAQAVGASWSATVTSPLADGTYTTRAEQTDAAGNTGLSEPRTFGVGSPPPPPADYRATVMSDSPRAYWRLGETAGLVAADQTANGISGSYVNGVVLGRPGAVAGDPNTAVALDGSNDTVRVPHAAPLNASAAMSLEVWLRPTVLPASSATIARKEGQYLVRLSGGGAVTFRLWKSGGINEAVTPSGVVSAGAWAHIVTTWDGATMRVYVNGAVRASRALAAPADLTSQDLYWGSSYNSYDYLAGAIDEAAVYPTALSATRIGSHFDAAGGSTVTPTVTLAAPAAGSTTEATPNFGGAATPGAGAVTVRVYSGTSATGTPVQSIGAVVQSSGTFSVLAAPLASGTYTAVAAQAGGSSPPSTFTVVAGGDPSVLAAGDIAGCDTFGDEATAALLDRLGGTVTTVGDHVYEDGTTSEFANCYDPTWGRHKARTRPAVGDHEYRTPGALGYFNYFGAAAGDPAKGYYSYTLGAWHVIALNEVCSAVGGCQAGSPQEQWLRADLAANPAPCTLAILHKPRFSSGAIHGSDATFQPFWQALYDFGADLVLSGDDHVYERFAPQTPTGGADPVNGIRQITVGTGGRSLYNFGTVRPNSEVRSNSAFGVLQVTLRATSYEWRFVPEAGKTFTDSGTTACH